MKKVISIFLSLVMLLSIVSVVDFSAYADVQTGKCGDEVTYSLDTSTGVLTISGTGKMTDYAMGNPFSKLNVKTVIIENGVTSIGNQAFDYCTVLTNITIPNTITSIGDLSFGNCTSLTSITIPDSVISIDDNAFEGCTSLSNITIPNSVTSIGNDSFANCENLTNVTIGNGVTNLGIRAFNNCAKLKSVVIPDKITKIGYASFSDCKSLTSVTISDSVTSIDNEAFNNCASLENVTIGKNIANIGEDVFRNCEKIKRIDYRGTIAQWEAINIDTGNYFLISACNVCGETIATGTEIAQLNGEAYRAALKAAKDADASKYTADSYAKVTEALAKYDEATVGAYTSQEDVDAARDALKAAVDGLVANPTTETYTYNFIDGTSKPLTVNKGETPENFANTPAKVTDNKNGTHTTTTYTWSQDGFVFTEVGSDKVDDCTLKYETVTQPTIKVEGSKTATCPDCGYVSTLPIDKLNGTEYYNALDAAQNVKADDFTAASYAKVAEALKANAQATVEAYTTQEDVDAATAALKDAVAKLDAGVVVTVASTKLGTTTLNGADATNGANARLAVGDDVVLTAKANNETGEFVGWKVGNKIVSDEATFKTAATADITYEPVFAEKADTSFTVVFVDPYGNVIDTQTVDSAANITVPTEPVFPGYTFTGWSMTEEQISKLTDGATIYAQYKKDDVAKYTVTANDGATITVNGAEVASPAQVAYDTKVSVHKDGAEAWKLNDGTVVGYGDTYTFFCGSDIELTPVMTAVQQKTTVKILSATPIEGTVKVSFLATRNVAPGETVVKQGFVYGKNLADSELTLDNVGNKGADANAGTVKILYNKNSAEQIALDYGLSKKDGKISAVAFVITKTADGTLKPTMSNIESYTY